jgi:hypothetical protein
MHFYIMAYLLSNMIQSCIAVRLYFVKFMLPCINVLGSLWLEIRLQYWCTVQKENIINKGKSDDFEWKYNSRSADQ